MTKKKDHLKAESRILNFIFSTIKKVNFFETAGKLFQYLTFSLMSLSAQSSRAKKYARVQHRKDLQIQYPFSNNGLTLVFPLFDV